MGDTDSEHEDERKKIHVSVDNPGAIAMPEFAKQVQWGVYISIMKNKFIVHKIPDQLQTNYLLSLVGFEYAALITDLAYPEKPEDMNFDELVKLVKDHIEPAPSVIRERYKFHTRNQLPDESIPQYISKLKSLAQHCEFKDNLQEALRDRLVCGLRSETIRKKLFSQRNLTFNKCQEIAVTMDTAAIDAAMVGQGDNGASSSRVYNMNLQSENSHCYCCGKQGHMKPQCSLKGSTCKICGIQGHIPKMCHRKGKQSAGNKSGPKGNHWEKKDHKPGNKKAPRRVYKLVLDDSDTDPDQSNANSGEEEEEVILKNIMLRKLGIESSVYQKSDLKEDNVCVCSESCSVDVCSTVEEQVPVHKIGVIKQVDNDAWVVRLVVDGKNIPFELDTGAHATCMTYQEWCKYFPKDKLCKVNTKIVQYDNTHVKGSVYLVNVAVKVDEVSYSLPLYVVKSSASSTVLGRNWLRSIPLNWDNIVKVHQVKQLEVFRPEIDSVEKLVRAYPEVFTKLPGTLKGTKGTLVLKEGAQPIALRARSIPLAHQVLVENTIHKMVEEKTLVKLSDEELAKARWATPIVPIIQQEKSQIPKVRICGDFKVTVNPNLVIPQYPLPKIDEIFAKLGGGEKFTKLDLNSAYLQLEMDEPSQELQTVVTPWGLYKFTRLAFGIASAPAIWQAKMDNIHVGLKKTYCYLDDTIITGSSPVEHWFHLVVLTERYKNAGLTVNIEKSKFFQNKVEYCGHIIDKNGLSTSNRKVEAVQKAPKPTTQTQILSFCGMMNYYGKFLPNLSRILSPLYSCANKPKFEWNEKCDKAFKEAKCMLLSHKVLCHYDPSLPLVLACDAAESGMGACLSHVFPEGTERPLMFASSTWSKAEQNYCILDKEARAIVWSVKKYDLYLRGRHFTVITDHKPLIYNFSPKASLSSICDRRRQRWAEFLSQYDYDIKYRKTDENCNADCLSRLPLPVQVEPDDSAVSVNFLLLDSAPVTAKEISKEIRKDKILSVVLNCVKHNQWPNKVPDILKEYSRHSSEYSIEHNCIVRGGRVVIPSSLRPQILKEIHSGHLGITKMKSIARSFVWWPGLNNEIEKITVACNGCSRVSKAPAKAPYHPWEWPREPWERLHIDFAEFMKTMYLIIVDAHSKWPEVIKMQSTNSSALVDALIPLFAQFGLPKVIVSDNGAQLVSKEFASFCVKNGIRHLTIAPYHPNSNGQAERDVQSFKHALKASMFDNTSNLDKLYTWLLAYRNAEHAFTGQSPAMLMFGRGLRTRLSLTKSFDIRPKTRQKLTLEKSRTFSVGDLVRIRNGINADEWKNGVILKKEGNVMYIIKEVDGTIHRKHVDQLLSSVSSDKSATCQTEVAPKIDVDDFSSDSESDVPETEQLSSSVANEPPVTTQNNELVVTPNALQVVQDIPILRRSSRVIKKPKRLNLKLSMS